MAGWVLVEILIINSANHVTIEYLQWWHVFTIYYVFHSAKPYLQCSGGCVFLLDSNNCHGVHLHQVLFAFCICMCAIAFYVLSVFMCEFPPRVYMEAVKLESMHAPEHVMSSLVVAQVLIYKYIMVKCVVVIVCHKKSSLFQFGQFSDLSHGVSNTFWQVNTHCDWCATNHFFAI